MGLERVKVHVLTLRARGERRGGDREEKGSGWDGERAHTTLGTEQEEASSTKDKIFTNTVTSSLELAAEG